MAKDKTNCITIIEGRSLKKIFTSKEDREKINFILNKSVNQEDLTRIIKKQRILDYVLTKFTKEGKKPSCIEINNTLQTDLYSYFTNFVEIYKILGIPPPLRNMGGLRAVNSDTQVINLWKEEFKKFILEEIKQGKKYPSGIEIAKHFGISHVWNIIKVSELYEEIGLKSYQKRGQGSRSITFAPSVRYESQSEDVSRINSRMILS